MGSQLAGAVSVPIGELDGTAKSLAASAAGAGYSVIAEVRMTPSDPMNPFAVPERLPGLRLRGRMHGWAFSAILRASGRWDVGMRRPGWPDLLSDVTALRAVFKAQTPVGVGRARVSR